MVISSVSSILCRYAAQYSVFDLLFILNLLQYCLYPPPAGCRPIKHQLKTLQQFQYSPWMEFMQQNDTQLLHKIFRSNKYIIWMHNHLSTPILGGEIFLMVSIIYGLFSL